MKRREDPFLGYRRTDRLARFCVHSLSVIFVRCFLDTCWNKQHQQKIVLQSKKKKRKRKRKRKKERIKNERKIGKTWKDPINHGQRKQEGRKNVSVRQSKNDLWSTSMVPSRPNKILVPKRNDLTTRMILPVDSEMRTKWLTSDWGIEVLSLRIWRRKCTKSNGFHPSI